MSKAVAFFDGGFSFFMVLGKLFTFFVYPACYRKKSTLEKCCKSKQKEAQNSRFKSLLLVRVFITDSENQGQTQAAEQAYSSIKVPFRTFDFHSDAGYNGTTTTKEVPNMTKVKRLTLDRYEHGLLVRALYEEWHRMMAEEKPTEDIEDLILKVIDAPTK